MIYVGSMAYANLFLNGNISESVAGDIIFRGSAPVMTVIPLECRLQQLKEIVVEELQIPTNQEVQMLKYRCPVTFGDTSKFTESTLNHDRHVQLMLNMYTNSPNWNIIELYVETIDRVVECDHGMAQQSDHAMGSYIPYVPTQRLCSQLPDFESTQYASPSHVPPRPNIASNVSPPNIASHDVDMGLETNDDIEDSWQADQQSDNEFDQEPECYSEDGLDVDDVHPAMMGSPVVEHCMDETYLNTEPPHYTDIDWAAVDMPEHPLDMLRSKWDVSHELGIGMTFPSKEAVTLAIKHYHIHRHQDFVVDE